MDIEMDINSYVEDWSQKLTMAYQQSISIQIITDFTCCSVNLKNGQQLNQ